MTNVTRRDFISEAAMLTAGTIGAMALGSGVLSPQTVQAAKVEFHESSCGVGKEKGHKVTRLTNAQHFQFTDTTIYYCSGHLQDAYQVAREMPGWNEMIRVANLERPSIKLKVLIGKDLIIYSSLFGRKGWDGDFPRPLKIAIVRRDAR